jgi:aspartate racemase
MAAAQVSTTAQVSTVAQVLSPDRRHPVLGIMGGMGPAATAEFLRRLIEATPAQRDQDHLHVLVDNDPSVPDRTAALLGEGPDPTPHLVTMATRLAGAGAQLLVMPCNTASAFATRLAAEISVPLLRWDVAVAAGLAQRRPGIARLGLLATSGTLASGVYDDALARVGVEVVAPAGAAQERVMGLIRARKSGVPGRRLVDELHEAATDLRAAGAEDILLACTELSDIAGGSGPGWLDAMDLVVERLLLVAEAWAAAGGRPPFSAVPGLLTGEQPHL